MRIVAHGRLRSLMPEPVVVEAATLKEAIESLGQIAAWRPRLGQQPHEVQIAGLASLEQLTEPCDWEEVHLVPPFNGSGPGVRIAIGTVLIVAAFFVPGGPLVSAALLSAGISLVVGGLIELFTPTPKQSDRSKYLGGPGNTVAVGTPIPVLYGRHLIYGHFISYDIDSEKLVKSNPMAAKAQTFITRSIG